MILRPSGAPTWVKCQLNPILSAIVNPSQYEEDEDTEVREDGTACHWAAATGAPEGSVAPNGVEIDDAMVDACHLYWDTLRKWPVAPWLETPVHCYNIHADLRGTPDAMAYDPATFTLYIADLKYGFRYVTERKNWQLICYFDGARNRWMPCIIKRVVFTIVQPRCYSSSPVRTWECSPDELTLELETLRAAAHNVDPNAHGVINPGCRNCAGRVECKTIRNAAATIVDASENATPNGLPFEAQEYELRYITDAISVLEAYKTGLEQQVQHGIKSGKRAQYFELRQEMTPLQWNAGTEAKVRAYAKMIGVSVEKPAKLITPTQAKSVFGEAVVNQFAQRLPKPLKLRPTDPEIYRKLFARK